MNSYGEVLEILKNGRRILKSRYGKNLKAYSEVKDAIRFLSMVNALDKSGLSVNGVECHFENGEAFFSIISPSKDENNFGKPLYFKKTYSCDESLGRLCVSYQEINLETGELKSRVDTIDYSQTEMIRKSENFSKILK